MSEDEELVFERHDFHNDPASDIWLRSTDGVLLGATKHRLRRLSTVLGNMFTLPASESAETKGTKGADSGVREIDMLFDSIVLDAVLTFANNPVDRASKLAIAHLGSTTSCQLLAFLRTFECPREFWDITLTHWCECARDHKARISIVHTMAEWQWTSGLKIALSALSVRDFAEIYANPYTFWAFIDGFREEQQKQLIRVIFYVRDGSVTLPTSLTDISTILPPEIRSGVAITAGSSKKGAVSNSHVNSNKSAKTQKRGRE